MSAQDPFHREPGPDTPGSWDDALCRLEDVLLLAPFDRALPNLDEILERSGVTMSYVLQDERALKLLGEAVIARPFSSSDRLRRSRAHVEMMSLEVEVLTHRLRDADTDPDVATRAMQRLDELAAQLADLRREL